jgi:diguanylate cyclase (GGDEF)-like protein
MLDVALETKLISAPGKYARDWRNWIAPAAIVGTLFAALLLTFLIVTALAVMGDKANEIDDSRATSAANTAVMSFRRRLAGTLEDNAVWAEAVAATQAEGRTEWIWITWGAISADYQLYDGVVVTDPDGRVIGAYLKGAEFDPFAAFGAGFGDQVRNAPGSGNKPVVNFFRIDDSIALVASRALQPSRDAPAGGRYNVLTLFKLVSPAMIKIAASEYFLPGLEVEFAKPAGKLSIPLLTVNSQPIGYLAWPGLNLGTRLYEDVRPTLAGALIALGALLLTAVFAGYAELLALKRLASLADREATRDPLSGLLNRKGMIRALQAHLDGSDGSTNLTLHLVDLDGFKAVNDTWGHLVGDELIAAVAARLVNCHPGLEFAARFGGDEFALASRLSANPAELGEAVLRVLKEPFAVAGHSNEVGASIGYAVYGPDMNAFELIRRADMALYAAKETGRGRCLAYSSDMDRDREALASLEGQLRQALETGELAVAFQPVVEAGSGAVSGVESLARWTPPQGRVSPDVFIPLAEKSGLIFRLGEIVLERSIRFAKAHDGMYISINVSPTQLCASDFAEGITAILMRENFDPNRLILEVTEGVLFEVPMQARSAIAALRATGVRFALDDFGTGYASIGTLSSFAFDILKLDRSLVQALDSQRGRAVLEATVSLAEALGIPVIAEGVETAEQAAQLHELGCQFLQGYHFGRPVSAEDFDSLPGRIVRAG